MNELPLILLGGVLGSSHCVGMCGGFALSIGATAPSALQNLTRQLLYSAGRLFTYAFLGAAGGCAGLWFSRQSTHLIHAQAILSVIAGVFLIVQGAITLRLIPSPAAWFWRSNGQGGACLAGSLVGPFFASPRRLLVFLAGVLNGFLPCGLVYGYLALASSTASLPLGLATMLAFGAGTVPVMVLTGVGASAFSLTARRQLFRVAGVCVLLTGVLAVTRGARAWAIDDPAQCPACRTSATAHL